MNRWRQFTSAEIDSLLDGLAPLPSTLTTRRLYEQLVSERQTRREWRACRQDGGHRMMPSLSRGGTTFYECELCGYGRTSQVEPMFPGASQ